MEPEKNASGESVGKLYDQAISEQDLEKLLELVSKTHSVLYELGPRTPKKRMRPMPSCID
jgi:hypothetical protein